jgi:predicted DNA-binding transcriptional regulator YafY
MKNNSRSQIHRQREMIIMIRDGMSRGIYANARVFMEAFEVTRRTVLRDVEALRDDQGAPIEYDSSKKGYYLSDPSWVLPPIRVSRQEVFAFSIAAKLLNAFRGTPLEVDMESLFEKIGRSLEGTVTLNPAALTEHLTVLGEDYVRQDPEMWSAVSVATDGRERVEMEYQKFDGTVKRYLLEPYHLLAYHGNWYVIGKSMASGKIATFAISRIRELRATGEYFEVDAEFDAEAHIASAFGIVRGEEPFRVRLRFSVTVAAYIRERVWHPTQRIEEQPDGGIILELETDGWKELVRWILSWQPDVQVLEPARLRERIREKLAQGMEGMGKS